MNTHLLADVYQHAQRLQDKSLAEIIASAWPDRGQHLAFNVGPLYINFSRQKYDFKAFEALIQLAENCEIQAGFQRLFNGEIVNNTEERAALHTALRGTGGQFKQAIADVHQQMKTLMGELETSPVTNIVSVGIGGSDLGPRLVADALRPLSGGRFKVHFVSSIDGVAMQRTLASLNPETTAGILISKTFTTQETLFNGRILQAWLGNNQRLYAVSANPQRAEQFFSINPKHILPMWDWVGGRYSLWSAVGFPIALAIGFAGFEQLLAGAAQMDEHTLTTPLAKNIPVLHGLTSIWNRNALGYATQAVLVYDQRLALLPAYLQQLVMESLGKRVTKDGHLVSADTVPVWWGGTGTDVQHSFFQALHQGTSIIPADFIACIGCDHPYSANHRALLANVLAQTEALAHGQASDNPHSHYPGGRPNTLILLDALTPQSLGALIAFYEHAVYVQSLVWNINPFDQFGVELGKKLANQLLAVMEHKPWTDVNTQITNDILKKIKEKGI